MQYAMAEVEPLLSAPRFPSSKLFPLASQRTARLPLLVPFTYFPCHPTIKPSLLIENASPPLSPAPFSLPGNSVTFPAASQRTGRLPLYKPPTYLYDNPTLTPAALIELVKLLVKPELSVPRFDNSIALPP